MIETNSQWKLLMGLMTDSDDKLSFRELAIKRSLANPKDKGMFVWVYRWFTAMTIKKLMFATTLEEMNELIKEWDAMDNDLGPAVIGNSASKKKGWAK